MQKLVRFRTTSKFSDLPAFLLR